MEKQEIAIRLASENIPLAVIARSCRIPFGDLECLLLEAIAEGRLMGMPRAGESRQAQLEKDQFLIRHRLRISRNAAYFLAVLMRSAMPVSDERLANGRPHQYAEVPDCMNLLAPTICLIRKALREIDVHIKRDPSIGFYMARESQQRLIDFLYAAPPIEEVARRLTSILGIENRLSVLIQMLLEGNVKRPPGPNSMTDVRIAAIRKALSAIGIVLITKRTYPTSQWELSPESKMRLISMACTYGDQEQPQEMAA